MDAFLRQASLEHRLDYYPLGFPLQLKTNSADVVRAAEDAWAHWPHAFDKPPLELRVIVDAGWEHPRTPVYRAQEHLMTILADPENFAVCDYTRKFAFCRLNTAAAADRPFVAYYFLEAVANFLLTQLYLAPVHAACIVRNGRGVLLSGASGAGKTTLAYFCARNGWTYVSDNESWIVRAGDRLLLGNPRRIRFRDSAASLFPELEAQQAAPHPNGKMSIVMSSGGLETAYQCTVDQVVFLVRQTGAQASLRAIRSEQALDRFLSELPLYEDWVREEQKASLAAVAALNPVELRYSDLEGARLALESLIA